MNSLQLQWFASAFIDFNILIILLAESTIAGCLPESSMGASDPGWSDEGRSKRLEPALYTSVLCLCTINEVLMASRDVWILRERGAPSESNLVNSSDADARAR